MKIINCPRCNIKCVAEVTGNQAARPVRKSTDGLCLECATPGVFLSLPVEPTKEMLGCAHIREAYGRLLTVGQADDDAANINWERLLENWDLPFPKKYAPQRW